MIEVKKHDMECLYNYVAELRKKPKLKYLFFELTDSCNLSCKHCGSKCESTNITYLPYAEIIKVVDSIEKKYGTDRIMVCLTGGEPMLHPDFYKIAEYVQTKGFDCGITTNGTLITRKNAKKIIDSGIDSVMFSLDGLEANHNWLRGSQKAFAKTIDGIKNMKAVAANKCVVATTTVIHKNNISELEQIYALVSELELDIWRLVNIEPIGRAIELDELILDGNDFKYLFDFIQEKRFSCESNMDITFGCSHYVTIDYERMIRDTYFVCGSGLYVASILCNGDIYSCLDIERRTELVQGNIYKDDFVDVWENRFGVFREERSLRCGECMQCSDRKYCMGDSAHTWDFENNQPKLCVKNIMKQKEQ